MTPNKKSRQWVVRSSTTHRRDFCRVLYLQPSFAKPRSTLTSNYCSLLVSRNIPTAHPDAKFQPIAYFAK